MRLTKPQNKSPGKSATYESERRRRTIPSEAATINALMEDEAVGDERKTIAAEDEALAAQGENIPSGEDKALSAQTACLANALWLTIDDQKIVKINTRIAAKQNGGADRDQPAAIAIEAKVDPIRHTFWQKRKNNTQQLMRSKRL